MSLLGKIFIVYSGMNDINRMARYPLRHDWHIFIEPNIFFLAFIIYL